MNACMRIAGVDSCCDSQLTTNVQQCIPVSDAGTEEEDEDEEEEDVKIFFT
jgi:hypothetical protein